jgi:hypothetical protein
MGRLGAVLVVLAIAWGLLHPAAPDPLERLAATAPPATGSVFAPLRVGAICADGWVSHATGSGACSHHGGVWRWLRSPCTGEQLVIAAERDAIEACPVVTHTD